MPQMTLVAESYIELDEQGQAWIRGEGTKVKSVVLDRVAWGLSAEEIHRGYDLPLSKVHAALAYYYDHQAEIDADIQRDYQFAEDLRKASDESPLAEKWRETERQVNVRLYMDVHMHGRVTDGLRRLGASVVTAQADGQQTESDPALLDRATTLGCAFVTHDAHLLAEANRRQTLGIPFAGLNYSHELNTTLGQLVEQLAFVCEVADEGYMQNRVIYLPMW